MLQLKKIYVPFLFHGMLLGWLTNTDSVQGLLHDENIAWPGLVKPKTGDPFLNDERWKQSEKSTVFEPEPLRVFTSKDRKRISRVQPHVHKAAAKYRISPTLINGIIWVESKFIVTSRGYRGSRGLMQLMPRTSRVLAKELKMRHRPFEPSFNVEAGVLYFSQLVDSFDGNIQLALAAYKQGPASVNAILRRRESIPGFSRRYVQRVLSAAQAFRERGY